MPDTHGSVPPYTVALPRRVWDTAAATHAARVTPLVEATLARRSRGEKHPVWDFLFTYYAFPPRRLLAWLPGIVDAEGQRRPAPDPSIECGETRSWQPPPLNNRVRRAAQWIAELCQRILDRPGRFNCYGLHEWAMIYGLSPAEIRHQGTPLRLPQAASDLFLESQSLQCTHYDAFRFFTTRARSLNTCQPDPATRHQDEQCGCLHANMDLYKWSTKLWPWIGSDLVGETFALAAAARSLDMRASPYDLRSLGFEPVPVETVLGRERYREEQQSITHRARPLRERLRRAALLLASETDS